MGIKTKPWLDDIQILDDATVTFSTTIRSKTITGEGHVFDVRDDGLLFIESTSNSTGGYIWVYCKPEDVISVTKYGSLAQAMLDQDESKENPYKTKYESLLTRLKQMIFEEECIR